MTDPKGVRLWYIEWDTCALHSTLRGGPIRNHRVQLALAHRQRADVIKHVHFSPAIHLAACIA